MEQEFYLTNLLNMFPLQKQIVTFPFRFMRGSCFGHVACRL
jgi:hypothetical protein